MMFKLSSKPVPDKTGISDVRYDARDRIIEMLKNTPIPNNLGLYLRYVILAKILYLKGMYERIFLIWGRHGIWLWVGKATWLCLLLLGASISLTTRLGSNRVSEKDTGIIKEGD